MAVVAGAFLSHNGALLVHPPRLSQLATRSADVALEGSSNEEAPVRVACRVCFRTIVLHPENWAFRRPGRSRFAPRTHRHPASEAQRTAQET
jgi:hypothetical protein